MTQTVPLWRPPVLRVLTLALAIAAAPLPALAEDASPPAQGSPGIAASIQKIAATEALASSARPHAAVSPQSGSSSSDLGSKSFFKSPAGIIALVAAGVAAGFTFYSTSHDRVSSPKVPFEGGMQK